MKVPSASRSFTLRSYSAAATALATLFVGMESRAEVITFDNGGNGWTTLNPDGPLLTLNLSGDVRLDGSQPSDPQFLFDHTSQPPTETKAGYDKMTVSAANKGTSTGAIGPLINPTFLADGSVIGAGENTPTSQGGPLIGTFKGSPVGAWTSGQRGYLGLAFVNNDAHHYGWADITVHDSSSLTLHAYGYESVAGVDIVTPVPEPAVSTLLMVAGAGGVLALRQRRKQAAKQNTPS